MNDTPVRISSQKEQNIFGLGMKASDKTISSDIRALSRHYHAAVGKPPGSVLPYYVLTQNYDEQSKDFNLFIGSMLPNDRLTSIVLPEGNYATITIKPWLGILWGMAIGSAKRYFYTRWLPASPWRPLNMEYEFHSEKSLMKHPSIELMFAVQPKNSHSS